MRVKCFKIGIAGSHSTGKTTFLEALRTRFAASGLTVKRVGDLATEARDRGLPILKNHTFESTFWIMNRGIELEFEGSREADILLVDRPVPDALGYLLAALKWRKTSLVPDEHLRLRDLVRTHSASYDFLLMTEIDPSIPIDTTKDRDTDWEFRQMAQDGIKEAFAIAGRTPHLVRRSGANDAIQIAFEKFGDEQGRGGT